MVAHALISEAALEIIMSKPASALNSPPDSDALNRQYVWERRSPNCFVCVGQAEVSRSKRGQPWVLMIPLSMCGDAPAGWGLMTHPTGEGIRTFLSAKEAMAMAEQYLSIFYQYHQSHVGETLDLTSGTNGISGSQAIGG